MSFTDQIAVITGGASGISHATAQKLAAAGATVCIGDIQKEKGDAAAVAIRSKGQKAEFIFVDLTDFASIKAFAAAVQQRFGRVDILVNGAGWSKNTPFIQTDDVLGQSPQSELHRTNAPDQAATVKDDRKQAGPHR